ncbi:MAG: cytochrome C [Chlorobi bacterium]|nr:cytochrome C [Chlorobiota bacterium]
MSYILIGIFPMLLLNQGGKQITRNDEISGDREGVIRSHIIMMAHHPDIKDSHHDFRSASWRSMTMCQPCHVPEVTDTTSWETPAWTTSLRVPPFSMYSSSTMNAFVGQPSGISKLCLSCHDGTIAIESHAESESGQPLLLAGEFKIDLSNSHPVSFPYDEGLVFMDRKMRDPTSTASGLGGTIAEDLLDNGRVECTSCHDPHISRNTQGCSGCHIMHENKIKSLSLRVDNSRSKLCLICHNK